MCLRVSLEYGYEIYDYIDKLVDKMFCKQLEVVRFVFELAISSVYDNIIYQSMWHVWKYYYSWNTPYMKIIYLNQNHRNLPNAHATQSLPRAPFTNMV